MIELIELNIFFKVSTLAGIASVEIANIYLKRNIFFIKFYVIGNGVLRWKVVFILAIIFISLVYVSNVLWSKSDCVHAISCMYTFASLIFF